MWFDEPALSSAEGFITNEINHLPFVLSYSKSNLVSVYSINLQLKNGAEYPLFSPGRFFGGGSDQSVMESRRQRLEAYIKQ